MNLGRFRLVRGAFALLFVVVALRLAWIQLVQASSLRAQARNQSRTRLLLDAPRGDILAADGSVLAGERAEGGRGWPWGAMALPLLGLVGRDGAGLQGLEYLYDSALRSTPGWAVARRTAKGGVWGVETQGGEARPGLSVVTTLRPTLQGEVEAALAEAVEGHGAVLGVAVVVEARSGDVVAAASWPSPANRSEMARGRSEIGFVQRTYEPGSTFKAVTLAAALESGHVHSDDRFQVGPSFDPGDGGRPIRDAHPHEGSFGARWCMEQSSNVCFAQIALRAGKEDFYRVARDFGFGTPSGVDLPGEEGGILRTVDQWSGRSLPTMAIGQEVAVTPLQVAMAYAALANGGVLMRPRMVRALVAAGGDTVERVPVRPVRRVVSREVADEVVAALRQVVDSGTGRLAAIPGLAVAGKTGTSQKVEPDGRYSQNRYVASFVGILPLRGNPLVCLVMLDDPVTRGHTGGLTAAPAFARIARFALRDPSLPYGALATDPFGDLAGALRRRGPAGDSAPPPSVLIEEAPG